MSSKQQAASVFEAGTELYPGRMKHAGRMARLRRHAFWLFLFGSALCVFLNLLIGGFGWALYVVLSAYIVYGVVITRSLVDASFLQRLLAVILSSCAMLLLVQYLGRGDWVNGGWATQMVIPFVLLGGIIASALIYLPGIATQRPYLTPFMLQTAIGIAYPLIVLSLTQRFNWPNITLLATSVGVVTVSAIFYRKPILLELKKKINAS